MLTFPRYLSPALALCTFLSFTGLLPADEAPLRRVIHAEVRAGWQAEKLTPAARAGDAAFLRRVHFDLVGAPPKYEEARQFLKDADPKKRDKLVERLLADPRFGTHQADVWDLVLFGRHPPNAEMLGKREGLRKWLAERFARNEPYDRWVRDLLLAEQTGTELYYVQFRSQPEEATVATSRVFLGTQLQCARCHDHPFENWTQKDFYGMTGFFVRLAVVDAGAAAKPRRFLIGEKSTGEVLFSGSAKDQRPGRKGTPVRPKLLGEPELDEPAPPAGFKEPPLQGAKLPRPFFSRKEKLAAWVTAPRNPWFARAAVNRVWAQFMGRGLVHPVDDLGGKNGPSHPALLRALEEGLIKHEFDLKWLIREVVAAEAYQLAPAGPGAEALPRWYERARVRPLSAEELTAALRSATGYTAPQLPGAMDPYVLRFFGEPTNGLGDFQGSLAEHLFLNNSGELRQMIQRRKGNLADALLDAKVPWDERLDRLFLATLTRPPTAGERERFRKHLTGSGAPEALAEEAVWVLLNCSEFRFNH